VQQPWGPEHRPGNAMGQWGIHVGRYQTWWEPGKAWFTYLWRCQTLLQTGNFIPASTETSATLTPRTGTVKLQSIHRMHGKEHIYFVANIAQTAGAVDCSFPIAGLQPELWDPVWGTMRDLRDIASADGHTTFSLDFAATQSYFIVFRKPLAALIKNRKDFPALTLVAELQGSWEVRFDPKWGGPASIQFDALEDWTKRPEKGIRYYSGTAVYAKALKLSAADAARRLWLDLGPVKHIAAVTVNGKKLGVVWTAPWRIDISPAVVAGENRIEIAVTNVWANRLIGDEQEPPDIAWQMGDPTLKGGYFLKELPDWFLKNEPRPSRGRYTFTTWNYFHNKDTPLLPSGLMGPVQLFAEDSHM